jgi:hypothetical protein
MLTRYLIDLDQMIAEAYRVLRPGADAILIVGNSTIRSEYVDNATLTVTVGAHHGFQLRDRTERDLAASKRYLPPPKTSGPTTYRSECAPRWFSG